MHTEGLQYYKVVLSAPEYRLVVLALARKLNDPEDIAGALTLNTTMCRQRACVLKGQLEVAEAAMRQAELLENPNIPPTVNTK